MGKRGKPNHFAQRKRNKKVSQSKVQLIFRQIFKCLFNFYRTQHLQQTAVFLFLTTHIVNLIKKSFEKMKISKLITNIRIFVRNLNMQNSRNFCKQTFQRLFVSQAQRASPRGFWSW